MGVVDYVHVARLKGRVTGGGIRNETPFDRVESGSAGVFSIVGRGIVVLVAFEGHRLLLGPVGHDEGARADGAFTVHCLLTLESGRRLDAYPRLRERFEKRAIWC